MFGHSNSRSARLPRTVLALVALAVGTASVRGAESPAALEYKVKGGYLFNFARYVEWPAGVWPAASSPFIIGVVDDGEAAPVLEQVLVGKRVAGHPVRIRVVTADKIPRDLHILLVTRAAGLAPETVRAALAGAPTLLVGETAEFAERGGTFGFVHEDDSIRLTLCLENAAASGLKISARLASVATPVKAAGRK